MGQGDDRCGDPALGDVVTPYPGEPGAPPSPFFTVTVNCTPVAVESFPGASYVHFAFAGTAHVTVMLGTQAQTGETYTLSPESFGVHASRRGNAITFDLTVPRKMVLWNRRTWSQLVVVADPLEEETYAPGEPRVTDVATYGPATDGSEVVTTKVQAALDYVAAQDGGGVLYVGPGLYSTGSLRIGSHTTVYLAPGAVLRGTANPLDYPPDPDIQNGVSGLGARGPQRFQIEFDDATGSRLIGRGVVDMNGTALRAASDKGARLLQVKHSSGIEVSEVILRDPAAWNTQVLSSKKVAFTNVKVINGNTVSNTDGIDPDSSQGVQVDDTFIYSGDDSVSVKSTGCYRGQVSDPTDIRIQNSTLFSLEAALKFGTESLAPQTYGITFENIDVITAGRAITVAVSDGSHYHDIAWRSMRVESFLMPGVFAIPHPYDVSTRIRAINVSIQQQRPTFAVGAIDGITFEALDLAMNGALPSSFAGFDATHEVRGLSFIDTVAAGIPVTSMGTLDAVSNAYVSPVSYQSRPAGEQKPIVSVLATRFYANPSAAGALTFGRTGDLSSALAIDLDVRGTAKNGADYEMIPSRVVIPAGKSSAVVEIAPRRGPPDTDAKTVRVLLKSSASGQYLLGPEYQAVVTMTR